MRHSVHGRLARGALCGVAVTFLAPTGGHAQAASGRARGIAARVDASVASLVAGRDFSGTVLVAQRGRVLVRKSYGLANIELGVPNTPASRFAVGSVTKTFTAAAIGRLIESGRLELSDRAYRYLPELSSDTTITIEHLLSHTAGVPDYYSLPEYAARHAQPISLGEFARLVGAKPVDFRPGTQSRYSNSGYKLLALVIERISGMTYVDYLRREFLRPLGMTETGDLSESSLVSGLSTGYDPSFPPELLQPGAFVDRSWLEGAGSAYSTLDDLSRWAQATRRQHTTAKPTLPRAYGWRESRRFGVAFLDQTGRIPIGYTSYVAMYPDSDLVVVVLSNVQADVVERLGVAFAAYAIAPDSVPPVPEPPRSVSTDQRSSAAGDSLSAYEGRYEIAPGFSLTVRRVARGLLLAGPDGILLPLNSVGPSRFFFRPLYVPVTFSRDSTGRVVALDWAGQFTARRAQ